MNADYRRFSIDGLVFRARNHVDGVLIDPKLPPRFDCTANEARPASHQKWWGRPYVETMTVEDWDRYYAGRTDEWADQGREHWKSDRQKWLTAWPDGVRYDVHCLDGGAWDRPTSWGMFATLPEAIECARLGPNWRRICSAA